MHEIHDHKPRSAVGECGQQPQNNSEDNVKDAATGFKRGKSIRKSQNNLEETTWFEIENEIANVREGLCLSTSTIASTSVVQTTTHQTLKREHLEKFQKQKWGRSSCEEFVTFIANVEFFFKKIKIKLLQHTGHINVVKVCQKSICQIIIFVLIEYILKNTPNSFYWNMFW